MLRLPKEVAAKEKSFLPEIAILTICQGKHQNSLEVVSINHLVDHLIIPFVKNVVAERTDDGNHGDVDHLRIVFIEGIKHIVAML